MNDNNFALLQKLADLLGAHADSVIQAYSGWFVTNSLFWIACAIVMLVITVLVIWSWHRTDDVGEAAWKLWVPAICVLLAMIMVGTTLPDLVNPKAAAIHQLLEDVRGK